jgi:heme/copper-type cytochrome/quinol oxidase subunit 2
LKNNKGQTAKDILEINKSFLELYDYYKLTYILSEPTGCKLLRMTRPIEKVERRSTLQICVLIFDVLNFALFLFLAFYRYSKFIHDSTNITLEILASIATAAFLATAVFYFLTLTNPGYVEQQENFIKLLCRVVSERYHLDYVCIHCENLRPENADHCNFCNRCV